MKELENILSQNHVRYSYSKYGYDNDCIVIKKNKYKIFIYIDNDGDYASDLQEVPYNWGRSGFTDIDGIIDDLREYLNINITRQQLSLF